MLTRRLSAPHTLSQVRSDRHQERPFLHAGYAATALWLLLMALISLPALANSTAHSLAGGSFTQDWSNTGLITANDDWSGVASIEGYLGQNITTGTGVDPQTLLGTSALTGDVTVLANQTVTTVTNGDVGEFHTTSQAGAPGTNPTIALQGSGTADAPYVLIYLNTTGRKTVNIAYNLRDIDCTTDNAVQPVALQYRVGNSGNFVNVPAGFIADATTGPSLCTAVNAINVTLPSAVENQAVVQVRIMTTNAVGNDEWVGIDDISVTSADIATGTNNPPTITAPADPIVSVGQDSPAFTVTVSGSDDFNVYSWSATPGTGIASAVVSAGQGTSSVTYTVTLTVGFNGTASFTATLSDTVNTAANQTANIQVTPSGGGNAPPTITPPANPITTVAQDAVPFTVNVSGADDFGVYNWTATPGTGVASVTVTGGQGTATATYTVSLSAGFNGTATFTSSLSDNINPPATATVNITVTLPPPPANHITISQLYGGGGNTGATYMNDYVELHNPTIASVDLTGWSVQYASSSGSFTQVQPLGGIIAPGEYFLVGLGTNGAVGSALPTPNISGDINMSATNGKVALVSNGTALDSASCTAMLTDPDLVDFVGYGTASCSEGSSNAAAASNTTALFRKNNGDTDTNINSADFTTGTPAPRRTSPIQEVGPAILSTDPITGSTIAPRDLSVIVKFTELVDVDTGWYHITCATTGDHDDATIVEGEPRSWVITPNVNFLAGESCTATIYRIFVHDRDTDDSAPNTDLLLADFSWSFTIATGAAPPYTPDVHLTMGNPSDAVADTNIPNNYLMEKPEMAISYNRDRGGPNWVSWHLSDDWVGSLPRNDTFRPDPAVPPTWYRVLASDFFTTGFDRGHMTPNADRDNLASVPINQATFLMSNMLPQAPDNNQGPWANLENYLRTLLPANELYIVAGGAGEGGIGSNLPAVTTLTVANGHVTVPAYTWKVVMVLPKASGDDVARVTAATRTLAVIMPNVQGIKTSDPNDWMTYIKTVDQVETLTGYDFFSNVPDAIENSIEAGTNGVNPPGASDESSTGNEDASQSITLEGASPTNSSMTYTIVTPPTSGGLSGTGASQTYTPDADFNGADSFTYKVNDGTGDSNTATVLITVREVNDAPVATDDALSAVQNIPLVFNASDLTANDDAGKPNEVSQTLAVTSVTATANTHGTVALNAGQVTYTPTTGYNGSASFTYTVCDDGTTAGAADSLCTNGTVNLTVIPSTSDLGIAMTCPASIGKGKNLTCTYTITNAGPSTATLVTLVDNLPIGSTYVGGSPACSMNSTTYALTCAIGTLNAAGSTNGSITFRRGGTTDISHTATASAAENDPNMANNSVTNTTTVTK